MSWIEMFWAIVKWVWENRVEIQKYTKLARWWAKKQRPILVIGPGGVGKTTLGVFVSNAETSLLPLAYLESRRREHFPLKDDPRVEVVIPPGQKHRRATYWQDITADIAGGKYRGVIVVVANGYHTLGEAVERKAHPLSVGRNKAEFLEVYLEERRSEELRIVRELTPAIRICTQRIWLMTLVLKQDLWWADRAKVESYYRDGVFGIAVHDVAEDRDARLYRHETVFASLIIRNFESATERLASNSAGYDVKEQSESIQRLRDTLTALKDWEEGK